MHNLKFFSIILIFLYYTVLDYGLYIFIYLRTYFIKCYFNIIYKIIIHLYIFFINSIKLFNVFYNIAIFFKKIL